MDKLLIIFFKSSPLEFARTLPKGGQVGREFCSSQNLKWGEIFLKHLAIFFPTKIEDLKPKSIIHPNNQITGRKREKTTRLQPNRRFETQKSKSKSKSTLKPAKERREAYLCNVACRAVNDGVVAWWY